MKRIFCSLLVLLLICTVFTACGGSLETNPPETEQETEKETEKEAEASLPIGYQIYDNGEIEFAYPADWILQDGSTVILVNPSGMGNNITVVYEAKNNFYATMDIADFETQMQPLFESMGMAISSPSVEQVVNDNGMAITKISYNAFYASAQMRQTMYVATVGAKTFTVTVTETTPDAALVENVFATLNAAN